jgi:glycosyltransferase involved in cell wall biosynthesis
VRPHIVDLHEEPYSLAVASALRAVQREAPKARVCIYSAQNIYKRYPPPFSQLERRALSGASAAYPCSTEAGQVLRAKGFEGRLHVLPLGVSVEPVQAVRVGRDGLRVGFLGRLEPYKGADMALRAFAEAAFDVDAKLELVGAGSQEAALKRRADRLGIRSRVEFPGALSQDEALRRISRYHIVVVPSLTTRRWKEQFGRVAAQAMAAGTPVIASDCGALPEVLGGCGEVFSQGDSSELAVKLRRLLTDVDRRRQMTECGRRRVVEHLSWERVVEGVDRMYSLALSDPQPHSDAMRLRARRAHGRDSFQSDAGGHYRRPR